MPAFEVECAYCHRWFDHPHRSGRRRIYCTRSCRQRAYECRRRLLHPPRPAHLGPQHPTTTEHRWKPILGWLEGQSRHVIGRFHVLVPGPPDSRGRLLTMCGTHAYPGIRMFWPPRAESCRTCARLIETRTPPGQVRPAYDLFTTQGHLVQVGRALSAADESGAPPTIGELRSMVERCLQPVSAHLAWPP